MHCKTPAEHRAMMSLALEALLEGRINVPMANAAASLSAEIHKSLNSEWDRALYMAENLSYQQARILNKQLVQGPTIDDDEDDYQGAIEVCPDE